MPAAALSSAGISLPELPWAPNALEPHISAETIGTHHGKHHRAYVEKARTMAAEAGMADRPIEEVILFAARDERHRPLFNNVAQAWNHAFYWKSLRPQATRPTGALLAKIEAGFGNVQALAEALKTAAVNQFASGWAWLVLDARRDLRIVTTSNAGNPLVEGQVPLLTIDVWEHAYYIDRREKRAAYVAAVVDHLLDWEFAARNLEGAA